MASPSIEFFTNLLRDEIKYQKITYEWIKLFALFSTAVINEYLRERKNFILQSVSIHSTKLRYNFFICLYNNQNGVIVSLRIKMVSRQLG